MREELLTGRKLLVMEMQTRDSRFYEHQLARMHVGTLVSISGNKATVQLQGRQIEQAIMHGTAPIGTAVTVLYSGNYAVVIGKDEGGGGNGGGGAGYLPLTGGTMTGPISLPSANPTVPTQAAHKGYVDSAIATSATAADTKFLKLTGGTLTGVLVLSGAPTQPLHAATKAYVDSFVGTGPFLPLAGGTMTGPIVLSANPSLAMHATPKQYVDLRLPLVGGTMTGFIVLHADPLTAMQAVTKQYVDSKTFTELHIVDPTEPVSPPDGFLWVNPLDEGISEDPGALSSAGVLGYAEVTANQGSIGASADLTGLSLTVTVGANRRIRITAVGSLATTGTGMSEYWQCSINEGATVRHVAFRGLIPNYNSAALSYTGVAILTPTAGDHTYKLIAGRLIGSGTGTHYASFDVPAFILIEDIGAA